MSKLPVVVTFFVFLVSTPKTARAQERDAVRSASYAAAFLPATHWSLDAVRRVGALGLAPPGFDLGGRSYTQREIGELFEHAVSVLEADSMPRLPPETDALIAAYRRRFRFEFAFERTTAAATPTPAAERVLRGSGVSAGLVQHEGRISTGWGYDFGYPNGVDYNPPQPREDLLGVHAAAELQINPAPGLSLRLVPRYEGDELFLRDGHAAGRVGFVAGWVGRRSLGFGPGFGGGIVLSESARLDGFGLQGARPFRLPWLLRHLGPVTLQAAFAQVDSEHSYDDIVFFVNRGTIAPHHRLQIGLTRAAMFGGSGNAPIDWFDVFSVLIGKHAGDVASELDNQVVAVDLSYRPATESWLPLWLYLEWGFEDSAGAWKNVPGVLAGVEIPAVPGLPQLALNLEMARFAASCCGNPIWYRHAVFHDGWTLEGEPLGHPLAGHGHEWSAAARLDLLDARLRTTGRAVLRHRGHETLYLPDRVGDSFGVQVGLNWLLRPALELRLEGETEAGEDWRETQLGLTLHASI